MNNNATLIVTEKSNRLIPVSIRIPYLHRKKVRTTYFSIKQWIKAKKIIEYIYIVRSATQSEIIKKFCMRKENAKGYRTGNWAFLDRLLLLGFLDWIEVHTDTNMLGKAKIIKVNPLDYGTNYFRQQIKEIAKQYRQMKDKNAEKY